MEEWGDSGRNYECGVNRFGFLKKITSTPADRFGAVRFGIAFALWFAIFAEVWV
jgi:hypothetical protein